MRASYLIAALTLLTAPARASDDCAPTYQVELALDPHLKGYRSEGPTRGKEPHRSRESARLWHGTRVTLEQEACETAKRSTSKTVLRFELPGETHSTADLLFWVKRARALVERLRPSLRSPDVAVRLLHDLSGERDDVEQYPWETLAKGSFRRRFGEITDFRLEATVGGEGATLTLTEID